MGYNYVFKITSRLFFVILLILNASISYSQEDDFDLESDDFDLLEDSSFDQLELDSEKIDEAINEYVPSNNRSQIIKNGNGEIILDAYNANPSSMETALLNFSKRNGDNKVLILGDMFELGSTSLVEHKHIIEKVKELNFDNSTFVGENFYNFRNDYPQFSFYKNTIDTKEWYQSLSTVDKQILIKGSRGMKLESLLS